MGIEIMIPIPMQSPQSKIELEKGMMIRIMGPARAYILDGCIRILGVDICKGNSIIINRYKSYCLKAMDNTIMSILIGEGGNIEKPNINEEVIDIWESTAREIVNKDGITIIVGAIESGKTSFSTLVSNIAIELGKKPCIIDADVGQGDLAPPTFIGMKCFDKKVLWLRDEKGDYIKFVGHLSPSHPIAMTRIVAGCIELSNQAKLLGRGPIIINTDGWLGNAVSLEYKHVLIKALLPTTLVVLGSEFCSTFKTMLNNTNIEIYCLPRPKVVRERSKGDRKDLRRYNYQKWFNNMRRICLDMENIAISGICAIGGSSITSEELSYLEKMLSARILYASRYPDFDLVVISDDAIVPREVLENMNNNRRIYIVKPSDAKGLISAITSKYLNELGVAIIDEIDLVSKKICLLTEYIGEISGIIVGKVRLDEHWNDSIRHPKCLV